MTRSRSEIKLVPRRTHRRAPRVKFDGGLVINMDDLERIKQLLRLSLPEIDDIAHLASVIDTELEGRDDSIDEECYQKLRRLAQTAHALNHLAREFLDA